MNNYVSPVIFDNDELAEGVYASGSGAGECWSMTYSEDQRITPEKNPGEQYVTYRIKAVHSTGLMHISASTTIFVNFTGTGIWGVEVDGVKANVGGGLVSGKNGSNGFDVSCTTTGAVIKRTMLADAYGSGDNFDILLRINDKAGDSVVTGISWSCEKVDNVQGTAGDELNNN
jgi:hypothetical protein